MRSLILLGCLASALAPGSSLCTALAQPPQSQAAESQAAEEPTEQPEQTEQPTPRELTPAEQQAEEQIQKWIDQLGSSEFAVRERAASHLAELGLPIVPRLRTVVTESADPEVRLRASQIVTQLADGDMQAKIDAFLAGDDVDLTNWDIVRSFMGDNAGTRELYVELLTEYPTLIESLSLELRDRVMAKDKVMANLQNKTFVEREFASKADVFALLLAIADPQTPFNASYESLLLNTFNQKAVGEIRRDAQLSAPFNLLLAHWVIRSTVTNRSDVLRLTMREELPIGQRLAEQTLSETTDVDALATAMQVISKFGEQRDADQLKDFLDDERPVAELGFARGQEVETQLGDVAMVAMAILHKIPLQKLGLDQVQQHPAISFAIEDVGFSKATPQQRKEAREKLQSLMKEDEEAS